MGFYQGSCFVPPLPVMLVDLRTRIIAAITVTDHDMLQRVWQQLDYQLDVCRVTGGAILNICNVPEKNLVRFPFHQY
jgi:hypothetical protein